MNEARIVYHPRADVTPESETATLAVVYRFILDRHADKQDADRGTHLHPRKEVPDEPLTR
jgi:hypothetical protein